MRRVVERALDLGIARLTLYAFSSDNWRRPASEVESIFWLLRSFLRLETERLKRRGVRLRVIGRRDRLPKVVLRLLGACEITPLATLHSEAGTLPPCAAAATSISRAAAPPLRTYS